MAEVDLDSLWLIFGYIGSHWENAQYCTMPRAQFDQAVEWQIGLNPIYRTYYGAAVAEYRLLLVRYGGNPQLALQALFRENQQPTPKLPDVASFVLLELFHWQVAFGGFRAFAYQNYTGWMGGGSFLQVPPPYRALRDESIDGSIDESIDE